jgi:tetratricopeptide (TPR) repeat protein
MNWRLIAIGLLALSPLVAQEVPKTSGFNKGTKISHIPEKVTGVTKAESPDPSKSPPATVRTLPSRQLGDLLMVRKRYREAIDAYSESLGRLPDLYTKVGIAYQHLEKPDLARENYREALHWDPKFPQALNNLGTVSYDRGDFKDAEKLYEQALKSTPDSALIYSNLGTALFARQRYKKAMEAYEKALKFDPEIFERPGSSDPLLIERRAEDRAKFHFCLSQVYAELGMNERADLYLRKSREEGFQKKELEEPSSGFFGWLLDLFR